MTGMATYDVRIPDIRQLQITKSAIWKMKED